MQHRNYPLNLNRQFNPYTMRIVHVAISNAIEKILPDFVQDNLAMKLLPVDHDINVNNLPEKWQKTMNDAIYGTDNMPRQGFEMGKFPSYPPPQKTLRMDDNRMTRKIALICSTYRGQRPLERLAKEDKRQMNRLSDLLQHAEKDGTSEPSICIVQASQNLSGTSMDTPISIDDTSVSIDEPASINLPSVAKLTQLGANAQSKYLELLRSR